MTPYRHLSLSVLALFMLAAATPLFARGGGGHGGGHSGGHSSGGHHSSCSGHSTYKAPRVHSNSTRYARTGSSRCLLCTRDSNGRIQRSSTARHAFIKSNP